MKIFIGGYGRCNVHNEKDMIRTMCEACLVEEVEYIEDADIILLIDTCVAVKDAIDVSFEWIDVVLQYKKKNAKVIVSGCLTEKLNFDLTTKQKELLNKVTFIKSSDIIEYMANLLKYPISAETYKDFAFPFTISSPHSFMVSPVRGCIYHCSFCKTNYIDFILKSNPLEDLKHMADDINKYDFKFSFIYINSSNLSLYGVDLYKKQLAHEAIRILTSPKNIKYASVGALINWYPELMQEVLKNEKIKDISLSLESGSPRIYELMNRPISLDNLIKVIKRIKEERPDIRINTEIIVGYPTETIDDLKRSIDLIYELDLYPLFVHPYMNSPLIPSSKLPQHSKEYCDYCSKYAEKLLQKQKNDYLERIRNGEMYIVDKFDEWQTYQALLIDGGVINIGYEELNKDYQVGDYLSPGSINKLSRNRTIK